MIKKINRILLANRKTVLTVFVLVCLFMVVNFVSAQYLDDSNLNPASPTSSVSFGNAFDWFSPSGIGEWILWAVSKLLYVILYLVVKLVSLAVWFLDIMMTPEIYTKTLTMEAISVGWTLVRDFLNMFFILIILFVAISTILRIDRYDARKMLKTIILAALLINFSKPIALFFIDLSQLAMGFFMNNITSQYASYTTELMNVTGMEKTVSSSGSGNNYVAIIASMIFAIIFLFIFAVMIFILALGLFLRLIAFLTLIVLSPFAFFGLALPGTPLGSGWDNWLKKMTNWGFFGPVLMFFLWLALVVMSGIEKSGYVDGIINSSGGGGLDQMVIDAIKIFIPYVFAIYLLWYGYDTAGKMAKEAGESAKRLWNKGEKWMTDWGRKVAYGTAAVGTLGVAPAAYYGGRWAGRRVKSELRARKEGVKKAAKKSDVLKRFVPESDDDKKDREAKIAAHTARQMGNEDEYNKYYRGKAAEIRKDWKEKAPMPDKKLEEIMMTDKNMAKRRAAAMELAERGKLNNKDKFAGAMLAVENDDGLKKKIRESAEKKNMHAIIEYDVDNRKDDLIDDWAQEDKDEMIERALRIREENDARGGTVFTSTMKNTLKSQMQGETKAQVASRLKAQAQTMHKDDMKQMTYDDKLKDMTIKEIKEQDINFHRSGEFKNAMTKQIYDQNTNPGGRFKKEKLDDVISKGEIDAKKAAAWKQHKFI